jgi:hypothetical protein
LLSTPRSVGGMGVYWDAEARWSRLNFEVIRLVNWDIPMPKYINDYWGQQKFALPDEVGQWKIKTSDVNMSVTDVDKPKTYKYWKYRHTGEAITGPVFLDEVPVLGRDKYLVDAYKHDPVGLRARIQNVGVFDRVQSYSRRSVFLDWLTGNLEFKPPLMLNTSPDLVNLFFMRQFKSHWNRLLSVGNVNRAMVREAAIFCEFATRIAVAKFLNASRWNISS